MFFFLLKNILKTINLIIVFSLYFKGITSNFPFEFFLIHTFNLKIKKVKIFKIFILII